MKRFTLLFLVLLATLMAGCTNVAPDAGQAAVLTDKPFIFGHGGVEDTAITTGRSYTWLSTSATYISIWPQAMHVAFKDYTSKDNIELDFDTTVQLQVLDSVALVKKYGPDWFANNIENQYAYMVREIVKTQSMTDMMSNAVTAASMDKAITDQLTQFVKDKGIPVTVISVSLGRALPNDEVMKQINLTAAQQQRQKTEIAAGNAEVQRKIAETARADADNAYRTNLGYTTEQYAEMQIANIQADACKAAAQCIIAPPGSSVIAGGAIK